MRSTKRVILADGARLLREMLHRAIDRADHLEVVQEVTDGSDLPQAIAMGEPHWVIISTPYHTHAHSWIDQYPSVHFIFLSPHENHLRLKWQTSYEEYADLSLNDFIRILEKDLQCT